ncbi:molecular chaperone GrpE [Breoghania corrubedonensis]|uniref:Protein GrpE n=1 Tax=Breoghania corrubedonensis TaxID=665038 RepID=A0A2T5VG86_9HYPH|nr:nucleotide exchange factor GrpE [Breoghania corrubedonensis]PTW62750.1 molecular chaperone GrpE [Breoghania corrubedonensis]
MSDEAKNTENEAALDPAEENARGAAGGPKAGQSGAANDDGPIDADALATENAEMKDRMLRTLAEMENLRRRTEREISDAKTYAVASFARDMLNVGDNLRRALDAVPEEMRANADDGLKSLLEGVEMTEREMLNQLEKHGVRQIDPSGEKFDPNFHQAMFEVPNDQVPNGTVVQVVQTGYVIGERVLRPAMVGVARGGPKAPSKPEGAGEAGQTIDKTA